MPFMLLGQLTTDWSSSKSKDICVLGGGRVLEGSWNFLCLQPILVIYLSTQFYTTSFLAQARPF